MRWNSTEVVPELYAVRKRRIAAEGSRAGELAGDDLRFESSASGRFTCSSAVGSAAGLSNVTSYCEGSSLSFLNFRGASVSISLVTVASHFK